MRRSDPPPRLAWSVPEAAQMLGVSKSWAYVLISRGELESRRNGRRVVVPVDAPAQYLASLPSAAS